jgi:hypothetical protein
MRIRLSWRALLVAAVVALGLGGALYGALRRGPRIDPPVTKIEKIVYVRTPFYSRDEVNMHIRYLQGLGRFEQVLDTYARIAHDREVAAVLLEQALSFNIPVDLLFGVVEQESHFNRLARGSYGEIGLMQLNPYYFGRLIRQEGRDYLWGPKNNVYWGARYLRSLYDRLGDWDFSVLRYNGDGTDALQYLMNVLEYERDFDKRFNDSLGLTSPWAASF